MATTQELIMEQAELLKILKTLPPQIVFKVALSMIASMCKLLPSEEVDRFLNACVDDIKMLLNMKLVKVPCVTCGMNMELPEEFAGKVNVCPKCLGIL